MLEKARDATPLLIRVCYEYLALTFSRRHGDPSRPWNKFSIENRKEDGSRNLDYEGNWRDIFQNWEALGLSFPGYVESMISKFVNASTADGYNPYRITRNGIDWEVPDPSDPWSNIGYWGDHQIIYLLKFLEISASHHPGQLQQLLSQELFSYANVPYRIKPYRELLSIPMIPFCLMLNLSKSSKAGWRTVGSDGSLIWDKKEQVMHVNLAEKLLVTLLSKLSNFIPGAGIWMNTQRPEWNDANNALVGYGVSMVTAYYLRAFLRLLQRTVWQLLPGIPDSFRGAGCFFHRMDKALREQMQDPESHADRKGHESSHGSVWEAGVTTGRHIYQEGFSGKKVRSWI